MGRAFALFAILAHEAAHRLLFSRKALNDWVGRWLVGYPAFVPIDVYRRSHMAHHRDEFGPTEPDVALYAGYPTARTPRQEAPPPRVSAQRMEEPEVVAPGSAPKTARPVALPHPRRPAGRDLHRVHQRRDPWSIWPVAGSRRG